MKVKKVSKVALAMAILGIGASSFTSCSNNDTVEPINEGIKSAQLILTEVSGETVEAHGDHFHGLDNGTEGTPIVITFDETGRATENGHLHIEADAAYKLELKVWDHQDRAIQNDFIANKSTADQYKAFIIGGAFTLNTETADESGAIFQPREAKYADGTAVNGKYEMTGVLSYFTVGHANEGATKQVTYVLRKLESGVKAKIERVDWNRTDYQTAFPGENVLELKFEIHAEEGHAH
ncbi:hypothetical protein PQ465_12010 [Sphingobacterium oryzagri]|uniref:Lipoprotein n=1 Tax=Sphingobacterium oryzagri TaxID=3025669 RepID=A0ABY7WFH1_9SPHI|nr:hypothetical protein [Sphingobacterium sp. KACC 22765]WDF67030.1 hypothetical protein PQ465_12010 [Sphingobacterium sp. KACC 22765]